MPRTRTKVSGIRKDIIISPYIQQLLDELVKTGDFTSESEIIRTAVINLYKDYEAKGKLKKPPESAEERIKNATLVEEREVEVD